MIQSLFFIKKYNKIPEIQISGSDCRKSTREGITVAFLRKKTPQKTLFVPEIQISGSFYLNKHINFFVIINNSLKFYLEALITISAEHKLSAIAFNFIIPFPDERTTAIILPS